MGAELLRWLLMPAAILILLGFTLYLLQGRLIFFPVRGLNNSPADVGLPYEEVRFSAEDGTALHGWFVPAADARYTVLLFHGNAGNIGDRLQTLGMLNEMGVSTLIFDYRGYGLSEGRPSEQGLYMDAGAAWRHLTEQRGIPGERIVLFGRSLGGGVASELATRVPAGGLVLESTFQSMPALGAELYRWLPVRLLSRFRFENVAKVSSANMPVLIVHSREDELIPYSHGEALFQAAREPKRMLTVTGGHNEPPLGRGREYLRELHRFLLQPG